MEQTRAGVRGVPMSLLGLVGWIGLSGIAGAIGAAASVRSAEFYGNLARPEWAPPGWLFGPVWTTLYVMMGIAAWIVWRERPAGESVQRWRARGLSLFVLQLGLNALWTWLFFAWRQGALAFGEIILLATCIALTALAFSRVRPVAAWLMVPYLGWVCFASALTWAIWQRNTGVF